MADDKANILKVKEKAAGAKTPPLHINDTASEEGALPKSDEEEEKKILEILQPPPESRLPAVQLKADKNAKTNVTNFIDERHEQMLRDLEKEVWFHGSMPIEDVLEILKKPGDFLLRVMDPDKEKKNAGIAIVVRCDKSANNDVREFPIFYIGIGKEPGYTVDGKNTRKSVFELVKTHMAGMALPNGIKMLAPISRQKWVLPPDRIAKTKKIGEGTFGEVWKGTFAYNGKKIDVAIKIAKITATNQNKIQEMYKESRTMRQLHHDNIIRIYGMVVQNDCVTIVMELVEDGGLDVYLRTNKNTVTNKDKCMYSCEIAMGLMYMHWKGFLHRELICRNCLIDLKKNTVKLAEFGLARKADKCTVPLDEITNIPWQAPEFLKTGVYTKECDVYSLGLLLWEIFHKARQPFDGIGNTAIKAKIHSSKFRPDISASVPRTIVSIMKFCWSGDPKNRPKMTDVVTLLLLYHNLENPDEDFTDKKRSSDVDPKGKKKSSAAVNNTKPNRKAPEKPVREPEPHPKKPAAENKKKKK